MDENKPRVKIPTLKPLNILSEFNVRLDAQGAFDDFVTMAAKRAGVPIEIAARVITDVLLVPMVHIQTGVEKEEDEEDAD
jgi:hypothetical protein